MFKSVSFTLKHLKVQSPFLVTSQLTSLKVTSSVLPLHQWPVGEGDGGRGGRGGGVRAQRSWQRSSGLRDELPVSRWSGGAGRGRCSKSGGPLGCSQEIEGQQVEHGEDQHQAHQDLLHPHARTDLLLQPRVGVH